MRFSSKLSGASIWWKEVCIEDEFTTLFSSSALGLDDVIGNFEVGKEFDALLINTKASDSAFDLFSADNFEVIRIWFMILRHSASSWAKMLAYMLAICSDKWQPRKRSWVLTNTSGSISKLVTCLHTKARLP